MSGKWLSVKKKGRDDAAIARDRAKAMAARKKSRKPAVSKAAKSFIVNDDDYESEISLSTDDDDDMNINYREKRLSKSAQTALKSKPQRKQRPYDDSESDSDSDSLPLNTNRSVTSHVQKKSAFQPSQKGTIQKTNYFNLHDSDNSKNGSDSNLSKGKKSRKNSVKLPTADSSSDDSDLDTFFGRKNQAKRPPSRVPPALANRLQPKQSKMKRYSQTNHTTYRSAGGNHRSSSSCSDSSSPLKAKLVKKQPANSKISKFFARKQQSDDSEKPSVPKNRFAKSSSVFEQVFQSNADQLDGSRACDPLEDTPPKPMTARTKNTVLDDDESPIKSRKPGPMAKKRKINDDDYSPRKTETISLDDVCSDEDEAVALAWALEQSAKTAAAAAALPASPRQVTELHDSSEEEDNVEDAYMDGDAQTAKSVLETANELSSKVLNTMVEWSGGSAPTGMILDGALALSQLENNKTANHKWISNETMKKVLPNVDLASYQLIGVNWLALLHGMKCQVDGSNVRTNVNGVLADEMGLGKTVQTIAFLSWLKYSRTPGSTKEEPVMVDDQGGSSPSNAGDSQHRPHLVVVPASVLSNWEREFANFAPHLTVVKYHGSQAERTELQEKLRLQLPGREHSRKKAGDAAVDVILSPVSYFEKENSMDRPFLRKFKYDYLVVDEAHVLKNPKGIKYKSLDRFATEHRLLLTGTPIQNSPKELMSLLCFLMPLFSRKDEDGLGNHDNDGGESMLQHFLSLEGSQEAVSDETVYKKLKQLFAPFVLRRRKVDVLSQLMPPKERKVELVELDCRARSIYDALIANHLEAKKRGKAVLSNHLFTDLRKAAHHPLMLRTRYKTDAEKEHLVKWFHRYGAFSGDACTTEKVADELERYSDFEIHLAALDLIEENKMRRSELERYVLSEEDLFCSAKFVRLGEILPKLVADGHRILIFSVWTTCLDLLSCLLEHLDLRYLRMDGQTAVTARQNLIDEFTNDTSIPVFLLSTKACGLGINLTAADTCIVHDIDFNPFNDLQAEDRCHRIGQKKPVTVIKMVAKDTVDDYIYTLQERKARMNAVIMESEWNKQAARNRDDVLQHAVDHYLKTPSKSSSREKENEENCDIDFV